MRNKTGCKSGFSMTAAFSLIICAAVMFTVFMGCNSTRPRPIYDSDSEGNYSSKTDTLIVSNPPSDGEYMYVTGVVEKISLKESDDNDAEAITQIGLGEAVKFINDDSNSFYYVSYTDADGEEFEGYIKKDYLTKEKKAVCRRTDLYIAKDTVLKNSDNVNIKEMKTNDAVFLISKDSGDYWYIYHKGSKMFGYVMCNCLSEKKVKEKSSDTNNNYTTPVYNGPYVGFSNDPPSVYESYYVYKVKQYLAVRGDMDHNTYNEICRAYYGETIYVINKNMDTKYWYCYAPSSRCYGYADHNYLAASIPTPQASFERYYVNVSDFLTLRETADSSGYVKGKMKNGEEVRVIDKNTGSKYWFCYSVKLNDFGYSDSTYLSKTKQKASSSKIESSKPESSESEKEYFVGYSSNIPKKDYMLYYVSGVKNYLAVRSEQKNDDSNILYKAKNGEEFRVLDIDTGSEYWYGYSPVSSYFGFVNKNYLSPIEPVINMEDDSDSEEIYSSSEQDNQNNNRDNSTNDPNIDVSGENDISSTAGESSSVSDPWDFDTSSMVNSFGELFDEEEWFGDE